MTKGTAHKIEVLQRRYKRLERAEDKLHDRMADTMREIFKLRAKEFKEQREVR